ncbi:FAD-dependent monooxygenase [Brevibacillus choshinensis]|uniref:FAD-dependent monooxygenase n=1 Tax=Brevibacillus choshinensis TaxID=54911 RepID=UPI002E224616|nr:FAD-dependent monooxygenase [Brevibacillus choshinensis]MED4583532.1 FAD-dependent monooxygenase [Brevibacillus choshinensis]
MSNTWNSSAPYDESIPVLIVGGSLIGLSMALFLSRQGIRSILVERHPGTSIHPRVASLTARTMEIFRAVGAESSIRRFEPAFSMDSSVPLAKSLVGEQFDNLMEDFSAYFTPASPVHGSLIAQDVLEKVLLELTAQAGGEIRYRTELVDFEQDEEGITATIRDSNSGESRRVRASFLVAADGSRSGIRKQLGIGHHGKGSLGHFISILFESVESAQLMKLFREREAVMYFLANDTVKGALTPYAGSEARSDIFRLDIGYDPEKETLADYPEERCLPLVQAAIGIPDFPVQIKTLLPWEMAARVSDRFQQGRVFLVGDAARAQPPSGALGGNTGIAEAQNLAWKLASVLRGESDIRFLDTYDAERRALADYTVEQVIMLSQQRHSVGSKGITVNTLEINMGYRYSKGAIVPEEDEDLPLVQNPQRWTGQPGTRAPHITLESQGKQISSLDLFGEHFVLLVGPDGQKWLDAAQRTKDALQLSLDIYRIGDSNEGDFIDCEKAFCQAYGVTATGAVIVRPDGYIGWRSRKTEEKAQNPEQVLTQALSTLLFREARTS